MFSIVSPSGFLLSRHAPSITRQRRHRKPWTVSGCMGFPSVHGVVRFRTILKRRTSSAGACFRSCLIRTVSRRSIPAFLRSYLRPSRALHRPEKSGTLRAACLISRPSWRIQRASGNQGNAPAAVGNTSETTMPLERATMPLERVNGPGGHRYRPASETAGNHPSRALHRPKTPKMARPIVENSPACLENTSAAVVSPRLQDSRQQGRGGCTEGEAA